MWPLEVVLFSCSVFRPFLRYIPNVDQAAFLISFVPSYASAGVALAKSRVWLLAIVEVHPLVDDALGCKAVRMSCR